MEWPLKDAKNQLEKLVRDAQTDGPQIVTLRGRRAAVVLSAKDYDSLLTSKSSLVDDLLSGPQWDEELSNVVGQRSRTGRRDL